MLKIDLHNHTIASGHAFNTIYEMAESAGKKGVKVLGILEHGPDMDGSAREVYFWCLNRVPKKIHGVKLLFGVELNIRNEKGEIDLPKGALERLDFASGFHISPQYAGSRETHTAAIINAMKNPFFKIVVHPYYRPSGTDIEKIAQAACDNNKLLEISTTHFENKNVDEEWLERLKKMIAVVKKNNFKILLGSDSHVESEIGADKEFRKIMKKLGLADKDIANNDIKYLRNFIKNI